MATRFKAMNGRKRRRLGRVRFSLLSMVVGVTLLSVGLAVGSWWRQRAVRQAAAVAELRSVGVRVSYSFEMRRSDYKSRRIELRWRGGGEAPAIGRWATSLLGPDAFFRPHTVAVFQDRNPSLDPGLASQTPSFHEYAKALSRLPSIRQIVWHHTADFDTSQLRRLPCWERLESLRVIGRGFTDDDMAAIGKAKSLRMLQLSEQSHSITDAGFAHLKNLTKMEELSLWFTKIEGEGLRHLSGMRELRKLELGATGVGDDGLKYLSPLNELTSLELQSARIHGPGLADLGDKPRLQRLLLDLSAIDDEALKLVSRFSELRELGLYKTHIRGPGLVHLQELKNLEELAIGYNQISDEDLCYLPRMETLKSLNLEEMSIGDGSVNAAILPATLESLYLSNTNVTDAVIDQLLQFPNLEYVSVGGTRLSAEGLKRLETARPALSIETR